MLRWKFFTDISSIPRSDPGELAQPSSQWALPHWTPTSQRFLKLVYT
jgi:hypothetical protein